MIRRHLVARVVGHRDACAERKLSQEKQMRFQFDRPSMVSRKDTL